MSQRKIHMVTGAFGYSGKYIAQNLLEKGKEVRTLTNSLERSNPFGEKVKAYPFNFDRPDKLVETLKGVTVLYNTYWVRFNHKKFNHETAVRNSITLFHAAKVAGVERIVHVSITNPSEASELEYFSGKARIEKALLNCGVSYAILRPAVLFGEEDILINNIAWMLRKFPVFPVFGDGAYKLQPIYIHDLAELAIEEGEMRENKIVNAIGPETFTYKDFVEMIGEVIGAKRHIIFIPPMLGYLAGCIISKIVNDIVITREEIKGLMEELLYVDSQPTGKTKLTDWAKEHASSLGKVYANELVRRRDRLKEYRLAS
jgi:NADH dehydrogenase